MNDFDKQERFNDFVFVALMPLAILACAATAALVMVGPDALKSVVYAIFGG